MTTVATPIMKNLAVNWASSCGYRSAKISGIVPDQDHLVRGGYHCSREDNPKNNYSVVRPDDRVGPGNAAAAIDMNMNPADMKLCTARLCSAYANVADPRRKYINAFNGWTGTGGAQRWDFYARKIKFATADHKWHIHLEVRRGYAASPIAMAAILSILKGEPVAAYLKSIGVISPVASRASTSVSVPPFAGTLRRNDRQAKPDPNVKLFQIQMTKRGWTSLGACDGYFGAKLESVVKRWQAMIGYESDGIIGPKTWPTIWTRPLGR